jgi:hypothetical protein
VENFILPRFIEALAWKRKPEAGLDSVSGTVALYTLEVIR